MKMLRLGLVLSAVWLGSWNAHAKDNLSPTQKKQAIKFVRMSIASASLSMNMSTWADFLDHLLAREFINSTELTRMKDLLGKEGVDLNSKPPLVTVKGDTLQWGAYSVKVRDDLTLHLQNGRIFKPGSNQRFFEVFTSLMGSLANAKSASVPNLFWPEAHAGPVQRAADAVGAALSTAVAFGAGLVSGAMSAGFGAACGAVGVPVDFVIYQLRWMIFNKTVECDGFHYKYLTYPSFLKSMGEDFMEVYKDNEGPFSKAVLGGLGAFGALCAGPMSSMFGFKYSSRSSGTPGAIAKQIELEPVREALGGDFQNCTPENADKVGAFLKKKAESLHAELMGAMKDAASKARDGSKGNPATVK